MTRHCCETVYCEADCGRSAHGCEIERDTWVCEPCKMLWRKLRDEQDAPSPATSDTKGDTP